MKICQNCHLQTIELCIFSVAKVPKFIPENGFMFDRSPTLSTAQVFQWDNLSTLFDPSEFQSPQVQ